MLFTDVSSVFKTQCKLILQSIQCEKVKKIDWFCSMFN